MSRSARSRSAAKAAPRSYAGRTAVVTGAGSGIGRALAVELARRGAALALSDVDKAAALDTAEQCRALGATADGFELDVTHRQAVFAHADEVAASFGRIDLVVNNAGVAVHGPVRELSHADMTWLMDVNFWGVVHGTQAFLPHLAASGDGQLANVSSVFGLISVPHQAIYNASKFAVRGWTEALRQECAADGSPVSISCIHPGGVRTAIASSMRTTGSQDAAHVADIFDKTARSSPEKAARVILHGLERDKARILVGPDAYLMAALPRLLGASYGALTARAAQRLGT